MLNQSYIRAFYSGSEPEARDMGGSVMTTLPYKHRTLVPVRDHPLMSYRGVCNWPPSWISTCSVPSEKLHGEIGILKSVKLYDLTPNRCFLIIEFQNMHYMGSLLFEDAAFCRQIHNFLQEHIGQSIKEIGDLDVSHFL
jgi:hypothetical protein